jgi:hypothetical protein
LKVVLPSIGLGAALCAAWFLLIQPMIGRQVRDIDVPKVSRPTPALAENPEVASIVRPNAAAELSALREKLGQVVHVEGAVTAMNEEPATDTRLLRLGTSATGAGIVLAFPNASQSTEHSAEALAALVGKKISVEGTLSENNGALRLLVSNFKLVSAAP